MDFTTTINEIEKDLTNSGDDYHLLARHRVTLSGIYSNITEQLKKVLRKKAEGWIALRIKHKSNADAESEWESSESGIKEMELKLDLKRIEKMMSSLKTLIDTEQNDNWHTPR